MGRGSPSGFNTHSLNNPDFYMAVEGWGTPSGGATLWPLKPRLLAALREVGFNEGAAILFTENGEINLDGRANHLVFDRKEALSFVKGFKVVTGTAGYGVASQINRNIPRGIHGNHGFIPKKIGHNGEIISFTNQILAAFSVVRKWRNAGAFRRAFMPRWVKNV